MCIRDRFYILAIDLLVRENQSERAVERAAAATILDPENDACLLYTSDAADERSSVDLGGRRIIKKKTHKERRHRRRAQRYKNRDVMHRTWNQNE